MHWMQSFRSEQYNTPDLSFVLGDTQRPEGRRLLRTDMARTKESTRLRNRVYHEHLRRERLAQLQHAEDVARELSRILLALNEVARPERWYADDAPALCEHDQAVARLHARLRPLAFARLPTGACEPEGHIDVLSREDDDDEEEVAPSPSRKRGREESAAPLPWKKRILASSVALLKE